VPLDGDPGASRSAAAPREVGAWSRPVLLLALVWLALAPSALLILSHSEYHSAGPTVGWQRASLAEGAALQAWTRNRLLVWLALYLSGALALFAGRRRDPRGDKLRVLGGTTPGLVAAPLLLLVLCALQTVADPADVLLVGLALGAGFLALWALRPSGRALAEAVGNAALAAVALLGLAVAGELAMRTPAMKAWTGGSLEDRVALRESWDRSVVTQRLGLMWRSRHLYERKPPGVTRVFALGDSYSFGDFIDDADALWPNRLEDLLNARGRALQVINSANAGASTHGQLEVLESIGWSYEPDVVVLQFTLNDVGQDPREETAPLLPILGTSLKRKSSLYHYLNVQFAGLQYAILHPDGWSSSFAEDSPGWSASREAMREIVRAASARGVPVVLLVFPMFDSDLRDAHHVNLGAHAALAAFAVELGIPCVDIRRALAEIDPDPRAWWVRPFDPHPNEAVQRVAAEATAAELERLLSAGGSAAALRPQAPGRR